MYGCQPVLLEPNEELKAILIFICQQANSLTNCGIYYARQLYFKSQRLIGKYDLESEYKSNQHFKNLFSQAAQQTLRTVAESVASFRKLNTQFQKGELANKPRFPKYRKSGGLATVTYPKQALRLTGKEIRIPLGKQVKCWFKLDSFTIPMPSNLNFAEIRELRILPRNSCFYAEFVYLKPQVETQDIGALLKMRNREKVLGIDPGLNNWLTCVSNLGKSFIIDGRKVKSQNQWYNKSISQLKLGKPQGFWNEELAQMTEKRNRQMRDATNKAARFVVNWCIYHQVGRIIFGWNQRNKESIEMGKKNNQEFVQIPTARLKERIKQLSEESGIEFIETEESYTSKSSFLDRDILPIYGEKPEEQKYQFSGKRGEKKKGKVNNLGRGGYETASGARINSDCNGAANILRKVAKQLDLNLTEIVREVLILPQRINVFRRGFTPSKNIVFESPCL